MAWMGIQVSLPSEPAPEIPQHAQIKLPPDLSIERRQIPYWVETLAAEPKSYSENVQLFSEGQPADHLYKVVKGAVRTFKVLSDGRRHITKFSLAGDFLGIGAGDRHPLSAETVTESKLLIMKCSALAVLAERDPEVSRHLSDPASAESLLLSQAQRPRIANDRALRPADRQVHDGALPGHQHRQSANIVNGRRGVKSDASF